MKKILLAIFLFPTAVFAQQAQGETVITAGAGYSFLGALLSIADGASSNTSVTPAIHLAGDYGLTENMSLGLAVGYQSATTTFTDYEWIDIDGNLRSDTFKSTFSRLNVGARALFHYGGVEKFDMYSGLRVGYNSYSASDNSPDPDYNTSYKGGGVGVQLIAFGGRGYITEKLGINVELAIGSPYFVMGGLSYKLGGN